MMADGDVTFMLCYRSRLICKCIIQIKYCDYRERFIRPISNLQYKFVRMSKLNRSSPTRFNEIRN